MTAGIILVRADVNAARARAIRQTAPATAPVAPPAPDEREFQNHAPSEKPQP
jgi:hypothetical protein